MWHTSKYSYFDDEYDERPDGPVDKLLNAFDAAKKRKEKRQAEKAGITTPDREKRKTDRKSDLSSINLPINKSDEKPSTTPTKSNNSDSDASSNSRSDDFVKSIRSRIVDDDEEISKSRRIIFKLLLFIAFLMIVAMFIVLVVTHVQKQNDKIQQFKADAGAVCASYASEYGPVGYENLYNTYGIDGYRMTGVCYAREMDFDANGSSELLLCYCDCGIYYVEVWGYVDDTFTSLYHQRAAQTDSKEDDVWITIRYGDGKYYIGYHNEEDITSVELYALKNGAFTAKEKCVYDETTESFFVNKKQDPAFERIKLSVLRVEKAESLYSIVSDTIDSFTNSGASSTVSVNTEKSVNNAYYEIVNDYIQKYGEAEYIKEGTKAYVDGLALVKLVDFNNDDIPELVLGFRRGLKMRDEDNQGNYISVIEYKYCCEIYTYSNGEALLVYENEGMSTKKNNSDDTYFMYKYNDGEYQLCANSYNMFNYGQNVSASSTLYSFDGMSFNADKRAEYTSQYGYYHYFIDGKQVYSNQFNSEGYFMPMFNGDDDYDDQVYTVVYLSRSSFNSKDVEPLVKQTQTAIKTLNPNYEPLSPAK